MRKILLLSVFITVLMINNISAQWMQVGYMISGSDTAKGSHLIRAFGPDIFCGTAKGLYKSTDNGGSWTDLSNTKPVILNQDIYSMLVASNGNIFAGSAKRVFKSTDGGATWTWVSALPDSATYYDIAEKNGKIMTSYAKGSSYGVRYSSDFGATWTAATGITSNVRYFFDDGTNLFLGGTANGVYKSTDNGQTWSISGTGFPASAGIWSVVRSSGKLLANSVSGVGLFESLDNGLTWTNSSPTVFNGFCQVFSIVAQGDLIIASNDGACNPSATASLRISTDNGATWNSFLTGTTPPNYFPVIGKNAAGNNFFTKRGNGKEVYRYSLPMSIPSNINTKSELTVYPNPSAGWFTVSFNNPALAGAEVKIYSVAGENVYSALLASGKDIDLRGFSKGIYFLKVVAGQQVYQQKLVLE